MHFLASSNLFLVTRNLGDSGINITVPTIEIILIDPANTSNHSQFLDIFQKYMTPITNTKVFATKSTVPVSTCYLVGRNSMRRRKPIEHLPTAAIPKKNIKADVRSIL